MKKVLFILIIFLAFISNAKALGLNSIYIDGKSCTNNSSIETCLSGETYSYDSENKTLTLNNYNGGRVTVYSKNTTAEDEITIHLKGENTVTYTGSDIYAFASGIPLTITADDGASLTINGNYQNDTYIAVGLSGDKDITIESGTINVNLRTDYGTLGTKYSVGIATNDGFTIKENATVNIKVDTDYAMAIGLRVGYMNEDGHFYVEKGATLKFEAITRNLDNEPSPYINTYQSYLYNEDRRIEGTIIEPSEIQSIFIDNKLCISDSQMTECLNGTTYSWNEETNTLTLDNYNSGRIYVRKNITLSRKNPIKIHLKGNNIINEESENNALYSNLDTEITADTNASLTVNNNYQGESANYAIKVEDLLTISGGNISVNNIYDYEATKNADAGAISVLEGIIIRNNANVSLKTTTNYNSATGIYLSNRGVDNAKLYVEENAKLRIELDVKNKLKSSSIERLSYDYYTTSGELDIKIEGQVEEINTTIEAIAIGNKHCLNDETFDECVSGRTHTWDNQTYTMTLDNYDSGKVQFFDTGVRFGEAPKIKVIFKGNNKITENSQYSAFYSEFDTEITSVDNGSLTVNNNNNTDNQHQAFEVRKLLTINGANLVINNIYEPTGTKDSIAFGILARNGIIIKNNSNVKIKSYSNYSKAAGIVVGGTGVENPKVYVEDTSSLKIDLDVKNMNNVQSLYQASVTTFGGTIGEMDKKVNENIEEPTIINYIEIDNKKCFNNAKINECFSSQNYSWDKETNTMTLNNYDSSKIQINVATGNRLSTKYNDIKLILKGNNKITEESTTTSALFCNKGLIIEAEDNASLEVNNSYQGTNPSSAIRVDGLFTIKGGNISANNIYEFDAGKNVYVYGIDTNDGLIIKDNANVKINVFNNYANATAISIGAANLESQKIYVEDTASLKIDLDAKNILNSESISLSSYIYTGGIPVDIKVNDNVEEPTIINNIIIDNKTCKNNGRISECVRSENYAWDAETKTLTLNNYDSGRIYISRTTGNRLTKKYDDINLILKGNNKITENSTYSGLYCNQNLVIDAEEGASLEINSSHQKDTTNKTVDVNGLFTIKGGNININNTYEFDAGKDVVLYGVEANGGLIVKDDANVKINMLNNYTSVRGIVVGGENVENPKIYVEDPATMEINLDVKNILNSPDISLRTYTYYAGTIGAPDIKITGNLLEKPSFREITIDGKKCVNDINVESCLSSETYSYDKETNTLTLNNYTGSQVKVYSIDPNMGHMNPIKIHLKGTNTIVSESDYITPLEVKYKLGLIITADEDATLTVTRKCPIEGNNVALYVENGDLIIEDSNIFVNNIYTVEKSTVSAAGIYASNITLKGDTNLKINVETEHSKAFGIYFMDRNNPTLTIEKPSVIEINTIAKNLSKSDTQMMIPLHSVPDTEVSIVYVADDNSNPLVHIGEKKDDTKIITKLNTDLSKYQYIRIEPGEAIVNPKTGKEILIYSILILAIITGLLSFKFLNKKISL